MRARRVALARGIPRAAEQAAAHLPAHCLAGVGVVGGYRPIGAELDPGPLFELFEAAGAQIALPAVTELDKPLVFRLWRDGDPLAPDRLAVPAPTDIRGQATPDLIVAPVLAFDRRGGRLGQGGGYFDRTLAHLRGCGTLWVIGLAFAGQELDDIPLEAHDQRLNAILTETGYLETTP